ncbi:DAN domain family member 5 [Hydra vulgaris]|uniref:DAN domain family member 5 n=1 Tax=Hydra vulgaris TaxID=6087 RepID=UPI001F5F204E|nr:DAN domain family member 5-like [Hydra vulgaris]
MRLLAICFFLVLCFCTCTSLDVDKDVIIRNDDLFYVKKKTYTIEQIQDILRKGPCKSVKYTQYIKKEGCFPVSVENKICGGTCNLNTNKQEVKCAACGPSKITEETLKMLCKESNADDAELRLVPIKTKVVKECSCEQYKCTSL